MQASDAKLEAMQPARQVVWHWARQVESATKRMIAIAVKSQSRSAASKDCSHLDATLVQNFARQHVKVLVSRGVHVKMEIQSVSAAISLYLPNSLLSVQQTVLADLIVRDKEKQQDSVLDGRVNASQTRMIQFQPS